MTVSESPAESSEAPVPGSAGTTGPSEPSEGVQTFRTREPIRAIQYRPDLDNCQAVAEFVGMRIDGPCDEEDHAAAVWHLDTPSGDCWDVQPGQWIVYAAGEWWVLTDEAFQRDYERAS